MKNSLPELLATIFTTSFEKDFLASRMFCYYVLMPDEAGSFKLVSLLKRNGAPQLDYISPGRNSVTS